MQEFFGEGSSERARTVYREVPLQLSEKSFTLGAYNSATARYDPKHLTFILARYKFASKMLEGYPRVLEVGCQEGLGSMVVAHAVGRLVAVDFYRPHIESCLARLEDLPANIEFRGFDMISGPIPEAFDGALSMDVLEHIDPEQEALFMEHIVGSLAEQGTLILGTPSLESQAYASPASRSGHINCKTGEALRAFCRRYFYQVFMFGMNDEVVHTGFLPMAHYLIALCVGPKR